MADSKDHPGRRAVLRAGVLGGGSAAALAATGAGPGSVLALADTAAKPKVFELFAQEDLNFETLDRAGQSPGTGRPRSARSSPRSTRSTAAGLCTRPTTTSSARRRGGSGQLADRERLARQQGQRPQRLPARRHLLGRQPVLRPRHPLSPPASRRASSPPCKRVKVGLCCLHAVRPALGVRADPVRGRPGCRATSCRPDNLERAAADGHPEQRERRAERRPGRVRWRGRPGARLQRPDP